MKNTEVRTPSGFNDEPAKMVRAEKKGATIGPTLGSLDGRNEVSLILSEKELTV